MRKSVRLVLCALSAALLACAVSGGAAARAKKTPPPREYAAKQLNAAHKAIAKSDYDAALAALSKAQGSGKLNESERALTLGSRAHVYTLQKNYPAAVDAYEQALALHGLAPAETGLYQFNLGQLYIAASRYDDAVRELDLLARSQATPTPEVEMGLANAYWGKGDSASALPLAQSAVARRRDAPEIWLRLLAALYIDQKQYAHGAEVLENGLAEGRVEPSTKTLDALATAWFKAGQPEKAEAALLRAADGAPDGRADLRLGQLLVEEKKWEPAVTALESALREGGLDDPASAQLLLGIARFELGDYGDARLALEQAEAAEKTRAEARVWLEELAEKQPAPRR
jgi:tetratricopeptide (TPR) repeat protein